MAVRATINAPTDMFGVFSKHNLRDKEVSLTDIQWATADIACVECDNVVHGYGSITTRLEATVTKQSLTIKTLVQKLKDHGIDVNS